MATSEDTECPTCGRDDFASERYMNVHHKIAHGESLAESATLICEECGKEYERHPNNIEESWFCSVGCKNKSQPTTHSKSPQLRGEYWRKQRHKARVRDGQECQYCWISVVHNSPATAHVHHTKPVSEGGTHALENLVTLCETCHAQRHPETPIAQPVMATGRALTTETEREYLRGEQGDQRMYEARSRVKRRIREELARDMELFEGDHPELLEELREAVCDQE